MKDWVGLTVDIVYLCTCTEHCIKEMFLAVQTNFYLQKFKPGNEIQSCTQYLHRWLDKIAEEIDGRSQGDHNYWSTSTGYILLCPGLSWTFASNIMLTTHF